MQIGIFFYYFLKEQKYCFSQTQPSAQLGKE